MGLKEKVAKANLAKRIQQLIKKVSHLNSEAKQCLQTKEFKKALKNLGEAEELVEDLGKGGRYINRSTIICILHNCACCYQQMWQLPQCSSYLEALIFNLNEKFTALTGSESGSHQSWMARNNQRLAQYYLQFCANSSQLDNHSQALISAQRSLVVSKSTFRSFKDLISSLKPLSHGYQHKLRMIQGMSRMPERVTLDSRQFITQCAKINLSQLTSLTQAKYTEKANSLGNIMEISPLLYEDISKIKMKRLFSLDSLISCIMSCILGYFSIASELRIISCLNNINNENEEELHQSDNKEAHIYHITAIALAAYFFSVQSSLLTHLINTYSKHYPLSELRTSASKMKPCLPWRLSEEKCATDAFYRGINCQSQKMSSWHSFRSRRTAQVQDPAIFCGSLQSKPKSKSSHSSKQRLSSRSLNQKKSSCKSFQSKTISTKLREILTLPHKLQQINRNTWYFGNATLSPTHNFQSKTKSSKKKQLKSNSFHCKKNNSPKKKTHYQCKSRNLQGINQH